MSHAAIASHQFLYRMVINVSELDSLEDATARSMSADTG